MIVADVPPPTLQQARYATRYAVTPVAQLLDGKLAVSHRCPVKRNGRLCTARIIGPQRLRLKVFVRETADGQSFLISGRVV